MYWQTNNNTDGNQADFKNEIFQGFLNMVNKTVLFPPQIKTTQRYIWTKREFTEEGKPLGELVDQVSLFYSVYNKVHLIDCTSQGMLIFCFCFFSHFRVSLVWRPAAMWWGLWWRSWSCKAGSRSQISAWLWLWMVSTHFGEGPLSRRRTRVP